MADPTPTPTPAPTPAPSPTPTPTPEPAWHGLTEEADVAYVGNKGWQSPADIIASYRGAEKLIGKDPNSLVTLPRADDTEGFRALMGKLGMPAEAKDYQFAEAKDLPLDQGYMDWFRGAAHKYGLTAEQVKGLSGDHNEFIRGALGNNQKDYERNTAADKQALLKEWGGGAERMFNAASTAASTLGMSQEMIDAIESKIGYGATMRFFADLGKKMSEDGFESGASRGFSDTMTPQEAKAELDASKLDDKFQAALLDAAHPGHKAAVEKQAKLFGLAYPS